MNSSTVVSRIIAGESINGVAFSKDLVLDFENLQDVEIPSVRFVDCIFEGYLNIKNFKSESASLSFSNCDFQNDLLQLFNVQSNYIALNYVKAKSIHFRQSSISYLTINNCDVQEYIGFINVKSSDVKLICEENHQINHVKILSPEIQELFIKTNLIIGVIELLILGSADLQGNFGSIKVGNEFNNVELSGYFVGEQYVKSTAEALSMVRNTFDGSILIEDAFIQDLNFNGVTSNNGSVRFNEVEINKAVITNSSIANFYWNLLVFKTPPKIDGCDLSGLRMANVKWSDANKKLANSCLEDNVVIFYKLRERWLPGGKRYKQSDIVFFREQIDTYRQLKAASIANHNEIEALAFYKNEMRLYWKLVRIEGGIAWYDRLLVFINRWSSDFGQNWFLPLIWITLLTGTYYLLIDQPNLSYHPTDWLNGFLEALFYLNPVRNLDVESSKASQGLDVLFRILNAYFIYHFIKATRKFGKT